MEIRVKDLMEISTTSCDTESMKRFNVNSVSDIDELFECNRPIVQFWVAEGQMCIIVE